MASEEKHRKDIKAILDSIRRPDGTVDIGKASGLRSTLDTVAAHGHGDFIAGIYASLSEDIKEAIVSFDG